MKKKGKRKYYCKKKKKKKKKINSYQICNLFYTILMIESLLKFMENKLQTIIIMNTSSPCTYQHATMHTKQTRCILKENYCKFIRKFLSKNFSFFFVMEINLNNRNVAFQEWEKVCKINIQEKIYFFSSGSLITQYKLNIVNVMKYTLRS